MSTEVYTEKVVVLHSGGVDPAMVARLTGTGLAQTVMGFTDTYPVVNPLNTDLKEAAGNADHLFIDQQLIDGGSKDAEMASFSQGLQAQPHILHFFINNVIIRTIEAPPSIPRSLQSERVRDLAERSVGVRKLLALGFDIRHFEDTRDQKQITQELAEITGGAEAMK